MLEVGNIWTSVAKTASPTQSGPPRNGYHQFRQSGDCFGTIRHDEYLFLFKCKYQSSKRFFPTPESSTNYGPEMKEGSWSSGGGKVFSSKPEWLYKEMFGIPSIPVTL